VLKILSPQSIAVIGASRNPKKVGHVVFKNLKESKIKTYPVNPNAKRLLGVKCYQSITELKDKVQVAIIAIPAKFVPKVIEECGACGVKEVIIISAGFKEAGNEKLEQELKNKAKKFGIKMLGPNVLGVIKPGEFNASFFKEKLIKGGISFISQSGALGVAVLDWATSKNIGFRYFISVGNMADINFSELIEELSNDPETKVIALYVESLNDGKAFMEAVKNAGKPVLVLKAGKSEEGGRAASSHTGSLAGGYKIYEAAFKQCGAISVSSFNELIKTAELINRFGKIKKKVLIISNAGGPGILITDACVKNELKIPRLPLRVKKKLDKELPKAWSRNNPIDVLGDALAERYKKVFNVIEKDDFYDCVIVLLTPQAMTEVKKTAKAVIEFSRRTKKPVIPCFLGGKKVKEAFELFKKAGIFAFDEIDEVAEALGKAVKA